jgi:6-phosphogluconolactonase (cycloisomerase 2 family)
MKRRRFLEGAAALAVAGPRLSRGAPGRPLMAYVGTFSSPLVKPAATQVDLPPGNGQGIHLFRVDRATGALAAAGLFELRTSPNCLVIDRTGTRMYSTNETDRFEGADAGSVSAFAIDEADGHLTLLNTVSSGAKGPTSVNIHPSGKFALVANYHGGAVAVLPIAADGRLGPPSDVKLDRGTVGPKRAVNAPPGSFAISGHDMPHAHMIQADSTGHFVLTAELGLDQLLIWKFDEGAGTLAPHQTVALPGGDGPRHFAFHPKGTWLYSLQEEGSNIVLYDYDPAQGHLTARQTISSLPPDFAGSNFTSEILVSADGRFVYAGNRLHDGIAVFAVGPTGTLKFVAEEWTRGDYPRSFAFDPTGAFLYSCNQRADNVTAFRVDRKTGRLSFTGNYTPVGNPSAIVFLDLARRGR